MTSIFVFKIVYNSNITIMKGRYSQSVRLTKMSLFQSHLMNLNEKIFELSELNIFKIHPFYIMHIERMGETGHRYTIFRLEFLIWEHRTRNIKLCHYIIISSNDECIKLAQSLNQRQNFV